jgi:hypothetical protein
MGSAGSRAGARPRTEPQIRNSGASALELVALSMSSTHAARCTLHVHRPQESRTVHTLAHGSLPSLTLDSPPSGQPSRATARNASYLHHRTSVPCGLQSAACRLPHSRYPLCLCLRSAQTCPAYPRRAWHGVATRGWWLRHCHARPGSAFSTRPLAAVYPSSGSRGLRGGT